MESNGIVTGVIPGNATGGNFCVHKTYEESIIQMFSWDNIKMYFYYPEKYGLFLNQKNEIVCLENVKSNNQRRYVALNYVDLSNGAVLEMIDAEILHRHLIQEAYERQMMLENNNRSL